MSIEGRSISIGQVVQCRVSSDQKNFSPSDKRGTLGLVDDLAFPCFVSALVSMTNRSWNHSGTLIYNSDALPFVDQKIDRVFTK